MNELHWLISCLIIATLLPYVAKVPLAWAMYKEGKKTNQGYNNEDPRNQQRQLTGFGARCLAAHENSFEALIIFAPAILLTIAVDNMTREACILAFAFINSRCIYLLCYWFNWDKLRSTVWFIGLVSSLILMFNCLP